jgi:hypothetical protein
VDISRNAVDVKGRRTDGPGGCWLGRDRVVIFDVVVGMEV